MAKQEIAVEGMTCHSCSAAVKNYLVDLGLENININLESGKVSYSSSSIALEEVERGLTNLGYPVIKENQRIALSLKAKLLISFIFTLPLLLDHLIGMVGGSGWRLNLNTQLLLAIPVYMIGVYHFGLSAWRAVSKGRTNMDVLIFLGSTAAFIYSVIGWYWGDYRLIFFETSSLIISLVLLGNWIEQRALHRTSREIDDLSEIIPEEVKRINIGGETEQVSLDLLTVGDQIRINSGEYIAIDGKIIAGTADIEESLVSGESDLQSKKKGDRVISGSLLVNGSIDVMMLTSEEESFAQKIVSMIRNAQMEKPKIQKTADRISSWFVPMVVIIAALCFLLEYFVFSFGLQASILNSIAILVIACPCALGLATPAALSVGLGRLTNMGILVKGSDTMQSLSRANAMIFDKTGTLTKELKEVKDWDYLVSGQDGEIDEICYALESRSNHPLGKSIIAYLNQKSVSNSISLKSISEEPGKGIEGWDDQGNHYQLIKDESKTYDLLLQKNGQSLLGMRFREEIKEGSQQLIEYLNTNGIDSYILSGDRQENVKEVAEKMGIQEYYGGLLPGEKLDKIKQLNTSKNTMMLGDGLNDAPSLQLSGVGMSFIGATDLAKVNSDLLLIRDDLGLVKKAIKASKQIMKTVHLNFAWAFGYNIIAIPLAALGYLNPMWAGLFMMMSDVMVIGNSLLLRRKIH